MVIDRDFRQIRLIVDIQRGIRSAQVRCAGQRVGDCAERNAVARDRPDLRFVLDAHLTDEIVPLRTGDVDMDAARRVAQVQLRS
ncbi:hypothetical protein SDC9_79475 [bioreactor metagenome]|uniref:Uncharacterized protein n=1 Tax=bioreactor metagenome TaxID=1076179 RepID=A0A644YY12_9ZZZZ